MFYNWKKDEIIRKIDIKLEKSKYEQSILVNKYYLVGISNYSIFVYNFLNDKLYEYPNNEGIFSYFKNNTYKHILNIYDNYFIAWNDIYYYIFSVISKGLHFIKKEKINPNNNKKNNDNNIKENKAFSYDGSERYSESYDESDDIDDNNNHLFSGNDLKNVFGESIFANDNISQNKGFFENVNNKNNSFNIFNNDNKKELFDDKNKTENNLDNSNNKSEGLFNNFNSSTGVFENTNNQNSLFGNINNQNESLFGNMNNQNEGLFGNINNQNKGLFGDIDKQNNSLFGNSNEQKKSSFQNNSDSE